jgi:hypothetical protein
MKVQILQLDPHDDLASTRDKLAWAQAQRVVLVWPDRARVLRKRLDLVLLRRQAARQGVELGIVTRDPVVLEHATALGIPAFRSSTRLPEETWQTGRGFSLSLPTRPEPRVAAAEPPAHSQPRPLPAWWRAFLLTAVGLALLVTAAAILPSAVITVHPVTSEQEQTVNFTLDPQTRGPNADGRVPARQVLLTPSGSIRVTTTGQTLVPGSSASGEVIFTNLTGELVLVPAGTGVLPAGRPDLRFTTMADLSLPADKGASASMRVVAAQAGAEGNLPAGSVNAIDGPLGLRASVDQPDPLTGGTQTSRAAVASADHAAALRMLSEQLLSEAASEIESQLEDGEALAAASLRVTNTPQSEFDRPIGVAADSVGLNLTLEVTALVYQQQDIDVAAALLLASQLPSGSRAVPDSLAWTLASSEPTAPELLATRVHQQVYKPVFTSAVVGAALGKRPSEAAARVAAIPGQSAPPQLKIVPTWWPVVPWLEVRVRVRTPWEQP